MNQKNRRGLVCDHMVDGYTTGNWVRTISTKKEIEIQLVCIKCPPKHRVQLTKRLNVPHPLPIHSEETHATIFIDVNRIFDRNSAIYELINRINWRMDKKPFDAWNHKFISLYSIFAFQVASDRFWYCGTNICDGIDAGRTFHSHLIFDWRNYHMR